MTSLSYKRDDGPSFPTDCFPARALQSRRKDGGGHRLVAYRKAEEQKNSIVNRRIKKAHKKQVDSAEANGNTLDGPFLLQLHCVDKPSELCSVDITEQKLNEVKPEDLKAFENVAYIDASVNSLSLASFSSFVSLRELSLCVNGIRSMTFDAFNFPHLEVRPAKEDDTRFRALEILMLDDNKLSSGVLNSVKNLNRS
ncbi:X-ray radiation resistance-associated protein 1-like [Echeneis naucrates]|uniref:X-ray radiation resistance-associated protein 1-like n=1 Tax=Echeneis naucrates TaxID=173247 RepID=UPI0011135712|nr:X-ray radiation resistance-associated protein 1-like [Echeneis naucrates]